MFSPKSEEPLLYEKILNFPLFENHISIPVGLPKSLHEFYLFVHSLFKPSQNWKQEVSNILFKALSLYMNDQKSLVTLNIPDSTSSDFLSVEISALQYLGSCLSVNKVPLAPHHN